MRGMKQGVLGSNKKHTKTYQMGRHVINDSEGNMMGKSDRGK